MQDDTPPEPPEKDDKRKIIHFPALEERARREEEKHTAREQRKQEQKKQEDLWRKQYAAKKKSGERVPFFNWDKIPLFTAAVIGLCLALQLGVSLLLSDFQTLQLYHSFGFTPAMFSGGMEWTPLALLSPVTSLFLHGGWMHVMMNMVMLLAMGTFFERQFGATRCAQFFLICGLCGNLLYLLMEPSATAPVIGASGAVSGLFAINMMMLYDLGLMSGGREERGNLKFLLLWMTIIIVTGFIFGGLAWQAHLGGFLSGAALYALWKKGKIRF